MLLRGLSKAPNFSPIMLGDASLSCNGCNFFHSEVFFFIHRENKHKEKGNFSQFCLKESVVNELKSYICLFLFILLEFYF